MKMLTTVDLDKGSLCNNISLTDMMDFKNPAKVAEIEEMMCTLDITEIQNEVMNDSFAYDFVKKVGIIYNSYHNWLLHYHFLFKYRW